MTQFTVLVTDDDKDIRDGIEIYLKNEGYHVLKVCRWIRSIAVNRRKRGSCHCIRYYDA